MAPFACHLSPTPSTADYPTQSRKPNNDAFVAMFSPGGAILYSTYLGGTQDDASGPPAGNFTGGQGTAIAVDAGGNAYVTGFTESMNPTFAPARCGAADPSTGAGTGPCPTQIPFPVCGALPPATSHAACEATAPAAYQSDLKTDPLLLPTVRPAHANTFLTKLNPLGTKILYSTYLGGNGDDEAYAVDVGPCVATALTPVCAYVVGYTDSPDFPIKNPLAGQLHINGAATPPAPTAPPQFTDAFVYKINPTAAGALSLVYSTYLGGSADEEARAVVYVNRPGFAGVYVAGFTASDGRPHPGAPGYPGSPTCGPGGAPPGSSPCPGLPVAFKTTPGAFQPGTTAPYNQFVPGRTLPAASEPDKSTPLPADPNEHVFIVKIADTP
jgi:hypothetical protein